MPKNETHLNCYKYGWPENLPRFLIPFYAMTGGSKSHRIKEGYWKEYSPRHNLIYEGEFKHNKKVGEFKYYDINGKLESIKKYSNAYWVWITVTIVLFSTIIFIWKKRKNAQ